MTLPMELFILPLSLVKKPYFTPSPPRYTSFWTNFYCIHVIVGYNLSGSEIIYRQIYSVLPTLHPPFTIYFSHLMHFSLTILSFHSSILHPHTHTHTTFTSNVRCTNRQSLHSFISMKLGLRPEETLHEHTTQMSCFSTLATFAIFIFVHK